MDIEIPADLPPYIKSVTPLSDGTYKVDLLMTDDEVAQFHECCNLLSQQLGRPVSKDEAMARILDSYSEYLDEQAAEDLRA